MALLETALAYNRAGYNVIPLIPNDKTPPGGFGFKWWYTRPQSAAWVEKTFTKYDGGNIGVLGGVTSTPGGRLYPYYLDFDDKGAYGELAGATKPSEVGMFGCLPMRQCAHTLTSGTASKCAGLALTSWGLHPFIRAAYATNSPMNWYPWPWPMNWTS